MTDRSPTPTRFWESLQVGECFRSRERTVTEQEIVDFASRYDPQYFHMDPEAARESIFGEVVASGVHNLAIWRQLDHEITGDIRWICGVAWDDFRWKRALRAGDTVHVTAECLSKRPSRSDPSRGIAVYRYRMINQDGKEIFHMNSTNLVERQPASGNDAAEKIISQNGEAV